MGNYVQRKSSGEKKAILFHIFTLPFGFRNFNMKWFPLVGRLIKRVKILPTDELKMAYFYQTARFVYFCIAN